MITIAKQRTLIRQFFRTEIENVEGLTGLVLRRAAEEGKRQSIGAIRRSFKPGPQANKGFFKAVATHHLPPRGDLGPASYVRLGVPFMNVFVEGAVLGGRPNLIVLTQEGARRGFRRIGPGNTWQSVWSKIRGEAAITESSSGNTVISIRDGTRLVPIYVFARQVVIKPRFSFYDINEEIARTIPAKLVRLLESGNPN